MEFSEVSTRFSQVILHICKHLSAKLKDGELILSYPYGYSPIGVPKIHEFKINPGDDSNYAIDDVVYSIINRAINYAHMDCTETKLSPEVMRRMVSYILCGETFDELSEKLATLIETVVNQ